MAGIDRGEGHPANLATEVPELPRPARAPEGMDPFAEAVRTERLKLPGRLVVQHGPGVVEALRPWSPRPQYMPDPKLRIGELGLSYLQVEFRPRDDMGPGEWRLVRDLAEIVAEGCLVLSAGAVSVSVGQDDSGSGDG